MANMTSRAFILTSLLLVVSNLSVGETALPKHLAKQFQSIWEDDRTLNESDIDMLRQEAWSMFDEGYTQYMTLAFPKDNLLPISCSGADWQGGMGMTLIDALDSLLLMGRQGDMRSALPLIKKHVDFSKPRDIKIHVFEVVIRVLGGLLSGHSLLTRSQQATVPEYDGHLLQLARDLAEQLAPAFNTPTGLPFQFINLETGPVTDQRVTCTACAGTLLLEYGTLSMLTGEPHWRDMAEKAATVLYDRRSSLGLVGASLDVTSSTWVIKDATIGPGSDSYYEYLLKSYLMFGNMTHLDMFADLYVAAMRHLQMPGTLKGYSFLTDVHMDSGRMAKPYVSSLGAFWPGMQALIGQDQDATDLHSNFTAAWQTWGWLPELFGLDLSRVHPDDPGYNLRPEHIESTYLLHALTGNPIYQKLGARFQKTLRAANKAKCGYASVANVETGRQVDLQESFFLSETMKYLYLLFSPAAQHLLDYYVLSTEGHIMPAFPPVSPEHEAAEVREVEAAREEEEIPRNCRELCESIDPAQQAQVEAALRSSFPLLTFRRSEAEALKRRRCIACIRVTRHMAAVPTVAASIAARVRQLSAELQLLFDGKKTGNKVLSQAVCVVHVSSSGSLSCSLLRQVAAHDMTHGLPHNAVLLQLSWQQTAVEQGLLMITPVHPMDKVSLLLPAGSATFGGGIIDMTPACLKHLVNTTTTSGHDSGTQAAETSSSRTPSYTPFLHPQGLTSPVHRASLKDMTASPMSVVRKVLRAQAGDHDDDTVCHDDGGNHIDTDSLEDVVEDDLYQQHTHSKDHDGELRIQSDMSDSHHDGIKEEMAVHTATDSSDTASGSAADSQDPSQRASINMHVVEAHQAADGSWSLSITNNEGSDGDASKPPSVLLGGGVATDRIAGIRWERDDIPAAVAADQSDNHEQCAVHGTCGSDIRDGDVDDDGVVNHKDSPSLSWRRERHTDSRPASPCDASTGACGTEHGSSQALGDSALEIQSEGIDKARVGSQEETGESRQHRSSSSFAADNPHAGMWPTALEIETEDITEDEQDAQNDDADLSFSKYRLRSEPAASTSHAQHEDDVVDLIDVATRKVIGVGQQQQQGQGEDELAGGQIASDHDSNASPVAAVRRALMESLAKAAAGVHTMESSSNQGSDPRTAEDALKELQKKLLDVIADAILKKTGKHKAGLTLDIPMDQLDQDLSNAETTLRVLPRGSARQQQQRHSMQAEVSRKRTRTRRQTDGQKGSHQPRKHVDVDKMYQADSAVYPHETGPCKHVPVTFGELVLADPPFACSPEFSNAEALAGRIAVVIRGHCSFTVKAHSVQTAGAVGLVVLNVVGGDAFMHMSGDAGDMTATVRIPSLILGKIHSDMVLKAMLDGFQGNVPRRIVATMAMDHPKLRTGLLPLWAQQHSAVPSGSSRVDMLVPHTSQAFVQAAMLNKGYDMQTALDTLLQDERIMLLLMQLAKENEAARPE